MRVSLLLIIVISFLFNGCFFDRLFQKRVKKPKYPKVIIVSESEPYTLEEIKKRKIKKPKKRLQKNIKKKNSKEIKKTKKKKYIKKVLKKKINKKTDFTKKKKLKKKRKVIKKVHHNFYEPYSIEKHEIDPELLGPQSTLKQNPLL